MPTVFVSHSNQDREFVEREIIDLLERHGIKTWYSRDDIKTADQWERSIIHGLRACEWFLVVISPRSAHSEWVKDEVAWAVDERPGKVIPVLMERCNPREIHIRLGRIQFVDFSQNLSDARAKLLSKWQIEPAKPRRQITAEADHAGATRDGLVVKSTFNGEVPADVETLHEMETADVQAVITNSVGMKLRLIPAGTFLMGSPDSEAERRADEGPCHLVTISRPFYLGMYEVTQQAYEAIMGDNPSCFSSSKEGGPQHPVERVSWDEAVAFCQALSNFPEERGKSWVYRLPTEAEWEYACRAGTTTPFHFGASISDTQANVDANYGRAAKETNRAWTAKVGTYQPNYFGLCDMHGNVWEWCADYYDADFYRISPLLDPRGPASGDHRVMRGGSWHYIPGNARSAIRYSNISSYRSSNVGFRIACDVAGKTRDGPAGTGGK